ncbi:MAG: ankyrin repeat domain-containing protein [Jatrophihabitantaceae bacterium]
MPEALSDDEIGFLLDVLDLARHGRTERLAELLEAGVPANLTNAAGDSLLILAAYHGQSETLRLLLGRGADTARVNDRGQTALAAAVFRQDAGIVEMLLAAGADPHHGGRSAVEIARFFQLEEMLRLLGQHPAEDGAQPRPQ